MLWEHMDATLVEPSACQNGAEALQPIQPGRRVRTNKTGNFRMRRDDLKALGKRRDNFFTKVAVQTGSLFRRGENGGKYRDPHFGNILLLL